VKDVYEHQQNQPGPNDSPERVLEVHASSYGRRTASSVAAVQAATIGLVRMFTGLGAAAGRLVNVDWVIFDLLVLRDHPHRRYQGYTQ
jgi:hypothetical protein